MAHNIQVVFAPYAVIQIHRRRQHVFPFQQRTSKGLSKWAINDAPPANDYFVWLIEIVGCVSFRIIACLGILTG